MNKGGRGFVFGIVLFFILVSFSLYFVIASPTDNVKSYDAINKEVTINNAINSGKVATAKLLTPQVNYVMPGKDR